MSDIMELGQYPTVAPNAFSLAAVRAEQGAAWREAVAAGVRLRGVLTRVDWSNLPPNPIDAFVEQQVEVVMGPRFGYKPDILVLHSMPPECFDQWQDGLRRWARLVQRACLPCMRSAFHSASMCATLCLVPGVSGESAAQSRTCLYAFHAYRAWHFWGCFPSACRALRLMRGQFHLTFMYVGYIRAEEQPIIDFSKLKNTFHFILGLGGFLGPVDYFMRQYRERVNPQLAAEGKQQVTMGMLVLAGPGVPDGEAQPRRCAKTLPVLLLRISSPDCDDDNPNDDYGDDCLTPALLRQRGRHRGVRRCGLRHGAPGLSCQGPLFSAQRPSRAWSRKSLQSSL